MIRLTFKDPADKYRLASQGSVMLDNIECSLTPSDRPNSLVYVHHFSAEGDDALLHYGKIVSCKHQYFSGRPNLLTGSRILTMSMFRPIPAEVMVDVYRTRVWYRGMQPFCQICKTIGHKAADCEFHGKCKECGAADHRAQDCPSRRGGRVWSSEPIVVRATVSPAVAETFPSIPVPEVAAAPPGVVVTEEVPGPSGVFIRSTESAGCIVDAPETGVVNESNVMDILSDNDNEISENISDNTVATNNDNQSSKNISSTLISENISDSMDNDNEISALNSESISAINSENISALNRENITALDSENISEFSSQCSSARMECKDSSDGPNISSFPSSAEVSYSLDHFLTVSVSVPRKRQNV